jgi:hypothetical protein
MVQLSRRTKAILVTVGIMAVAVNGGIAWAYWRTSGTATASATAGSVIPLVASGQPISSAPLFPGVKRNVKITITNNNDFPVMLTEIKRGTGSVIVDAAHAAECVTTGVSLTNATYSVSALIGKNATTSFTLAEGLRMTNASDPGCQGATFKVPVVVVGRAQP